jgi:hypothetical protein
MAAVSKDIGRSEARSAKVVVQAVQKSALSLTRHIYIVDRCIVSPTIAIVQIAAAAEETLRRRRKRQIDVQDQ